MRHVEDQHIFTRGENGPISKRVQGDVGPSTGKSTFLAEATGVTSKRPLVLRSFLSRLTQGTVSTFGTRPAVELPRPWASLVRGGERLDRGVWRGKAGLGRWHALPSWARPNRAVPPFDAFYPASTS